MEPAGSCFYSESDGGVVLAVRALFWPQSEQQL